MQKKNSSKSAALVSRTSHRLARKVLLAAAAGSALVGSLNKAMATDHTSVANGDFGATATWTPATVPGAADNVITNNFTVTITSNQATFDCNAGTVAAQTGTYTMTGTTDVLTVNSWFRYGTVSNATGTFNLNGGTLNTSSTQTGSNMNLGEAAGGTGNLNINGGTFNVNQASQLLRVGDFGKGNLIMTAGAFNMNATSAAGGFTSIGLNTGSTGVMTISGGTFTNVSGDINVGDSGTGTLNVSGTGVFNSGTGNFYLARQTVSTGTINLGNFTTSAVLGGTIKATAIISGGGTKVINFDGGTLQANAASATFVTLNSNVLAGGLTFNSNTFNDTITGALVHGGAGTDGGLTKTGLGTLTLGGADTYTGGTTISGGVLQFNSGAVPTTGVITVNGAGALNGLGAFTNVTNWLGSGKINTASVGAIALTAASSEAINFNTNGYNSLMLGASVNSAYTGALTPAGTTYHLGGGGAILTLSVANTLTGSNALVVGATGSTGTVSLTGANNYSGATTVTSGTLQLGDGTTGNDGSLTSTSGVTDNANLTYNLFGSQTPSYNITGTGNVNKLGAGTLNLTGTNSISGSYVLSAGTTTITAGTTTETNGANPIQVANGASLTATLTVGGTGTLTAAGEIWIGNGAATANGTLNLQTGGTINAASWVGIGRAGGVGVFNMTGGTLNKTGANGTHITLTGIGGTGTINQSGGTINSTASDLFVTENSVGTYNMSGTAVANLLALNLDTNGGAGTFNLNGGTVSTTQVVKTAGTGTGTFNFNGGTLKAAAASTTFMTGISAANDQAGGAIIDTNSFAITIGQALVTNGAGGLTVTDSSASGGGNLTMTGAGTFTGATAVGGNGKAVTLTLSAANNVPIISKSSSLTINNLATVSVNGDNNLGSFPAAVPITVNAGGTLTETAVTTEHLAALTLNGGTVADLGTPSGDGATFGSYNLDGTVTTGGTTATSTLSAPGMALTKTGGSIFVVPSGATSGIDLNVTGTFTHTVTETGLIKQGTGVMQLTGASTYTSATTVSAGTLQAGAVNAFSAGSAVTLANVAGATLNLNNFNNAIGSLNGGGTTGGNVTLGSGTLTTGALNAVASYGGVISGTGGLTKVGTGSLALVNGNTYSGNTTVSAGTLTLDHSSTNTGALGNTAVTVSSTGTLLIKGNSSIGTPASGTSLSNSGLVDMRDVSANTLTLGGALGASTSSFSLDIGGDGTTGTADQISAGGAAVVTGSNTININLIAGQTVTPGSYTIISDSSGGLGSGFTLGTKPAGFFNYSLASSTSTAEILTITGNAVPTTEYWTGAASRSGSDTANNWSFGTTSSNWSTDSAGTVDPLQVPGGTTDVIFTATNATPAAASTVLTTTLDSGYSVKGLTVSVPASTGINSTVFATNGNTLIIGADGLTIAGLSNSGATFSGTGGIALLGNQAWANNSVSNLVVSTGVKGLAASGTQVLTFQGSGSGQVTVSGVISDGTAGGKLGLAVSKTGSGILTLSGNNTYTGGVTLNSGILQLASTGALNSTTPNSLTFGSGSTGDLQLNSISVSVNGINTNATVGTPIIENNGAVTATLTDISTVSDTYAGVLQDGAAGGKLALAKSGSNTSTLTLSGNNTFTGDVIVNNGALTITNSNALGVGPKNITVNAGTTGNVSLHLDSQGGPNINLASNLSLFTSNVNDVIYNDNGNNTIAGTITETVGGGATSLVSNAGTLTISGNISANTTGRALNLRGNANGFITGNITVGSGATALSKDAGPTDSGTGIWTLTGGASTVAGIYGHVGTLVLDTGAGITTTAFSSIGANGGDNSTLTLQGNAHVTNPFDFNVTDLTGSTGTLNISGTAALAVSTLYVGKGSGTNTGAGTTGTVNQTGGSVSQSTAGGDWRIGGGNTTDNAAVGVYNLSGATSTVGTTQNFQIGAYGVGTWNQTGGTVTITNSFPVVGRFAGSSGTLNLSGGSFNQAGTGQRLIVGEDGTGVANINGTGLATATGGVVEGLTATGIGTINLGNGTAGGTLSPAFISGGLAAGTTTLGTGTLNFNGGTLQDPTANTTANNAAFLKGLTRVNIENAGAIVDSNGNSVAINQALLHSNIAGDAATDGGLTKIGAGTLTLTNGSSTFNGNINVNAGTLVASTTNVNSFNPIAGVLGNTSTAVTRSITLATGTTLNLAIGNVLATGSYNPSTITMNINGATLTNTSSDTETLGILNLNGGTITATSGTGSNAYQSYVLNDLITVSGTTASTISTAGTTNAGYHLGADVNKTITFNVDPSATGASLLVSAPLIGGSGTANGATGSGIIKSGSGLMTLSGVNTYTGNTTITAGTLAISGGGSIANSAHINLNGGSLSVSGVTTPPYVVGATQTLMGAGTVAGNITINGTLQTGQTNNTAGKTAAVLNLGSGSTLAGSTLLDLTATNASDEVTFGTNSGGLANLGGTLTVTNPNSISFAVGQTYDLFGFGSEAGTFSSSPTLPSLPSTLAWNTSQLYSNGIISIGSNGPIVSQWAASIGGSWNTSSNWSNGIPTGQGAQANFLTTPTGLTTAGSVTLDGNQTVGRITFDNANVYSIDQGTGSGTLTLDDTNGISGVNPSITVNSGNHAITAPMSLAAGVTVNVASGSVLTVAGSVGGTGDLNAAGPGTLALSGNNNFAGNTNVTGGTVNLTGSITSANVIVGIGATLNASGSVNNGLSTTANVIANGTVTFAGAPLVAGPNPITVAAINVGSLGQVNVTDPGTATGNHANRTVLLTSSLSLPGTTDSWSGQVDLAGNDLIVHGGSVSDITNQIKSGYNNGSFNGSGITSTAALNDPNTLSTLGVLLNNDGSGNTLYDSFDNQSVTVADVLVKYTYYGDANLDGTVNSSDYSQIDNGFNSGLSGWYNGDFNYDGVVNSSDYSLIDNAFNQTQGTSLSSASAAGLMASSTALIAPASSAAVPEPSSLCLLGLAAAGLMGRRRRRQMSVTSK